MTEIKETGFPAMSRRSLLQSAGAFGLATTTGGLLAACGGSDSESNGGSGALAGTLTFKKGPWTDDDLKILKALGTSFSRKHPKVKIQSSTYNWTTFEAELTAAFAGPNPPNVTYLTNSIWPKLAEAGALDDMTSRVKAADWKSEFGHVSDSLWASATLDDKIYGVPWAGAMFPLFVNKDLLAKAGATDWNSSYAAMLDGAKAMTTGNTFGYGAPTSFKEFSYQYWLPYIWQAGADLYDAEGTEGALVGDDAVAAWQFMADLVSQGGAPKPGQYDLEGLSALFIGGRLGIGALNIDDMATAIADDKLDFEWEMVTPPPGPEGSFPLSDLGYLTIAAKAEDKDLAWEYIKYLASAPTVKQYLADVNAGVLSTRDDVPGQPPGNELVEQAAPLLPKARTYPPSPKLVEALRLATTEYELVVAGRKAAAQGLEDANTAITEALAT